MLFVKTMTENNDVPTYYFASRLKLSALFVLVYATLNLASSRLLQNSSGSDKIIILYLLSNPYFKRFRGAKCLVGSNKSCVSTSKCLYNQIKLKCTFVNSYESVHSTDSKNTFFDIFFISACIN